jgi:hypothetical protein
MLNAYMIFSRIGDSENGAALVFAHTAQEARVVGWRGIGSDLTDEYTDLAANRLRNKPWLFDEALAVKFANDEAHVIDDPKFCRTCERWGQSPIGEDGLCEGCRQDVIDDAEQGLHPTSGSLRDLQAVSTPQPLVSS